MSPLLLRYLVRIGNGLSRRSPYRWTRATALATGFLVLVVGVAGLTLSVADSQSRAQRAQTLLPVPTTHDQPARLDYLSQLVAITDHDGEVQTVPVIWIEPRSDDSPLPPGIDRWPAPGTAVVSPQIRRDLGPQDADTWGTVVGRIGPDGLEVANERRIYARPATSASLRSRLTPISGFGPHGIDGEWGYPTANAQPMWSRILAFGMLLIIPGVISVVLGAQIGSDLRRRRESQLRAMGATRRHIAALQLSEARGGLAAGCLVACAGWATISVTGIHFGTVDFELTAAQIRSWWLLTLLAILASGLLAILLVVTTASRAGWRSKGQERQAESIPLRRSALCMVAAVATIWVPAVASSGVTRTLAYHLGVLIILLTLPALVAVLLSLAGELGASLGRRWGSPGAVLAGRRLALFPRRTAWLISGMSATLLLFGQVQLNVGALSLVYQQSKAGQETYGTTLVYADEAGTAPVLRRLIHNLPPDAAPLLTNSRLGRTGRTTYTIIAPCETLEDLGLPCRQASLRPDELTGSRQVEAVAVSMGLIVGDNIRVTPTSRSRLHRMAGEQTRLSIVSTTGSDLNLAELRRRANTVAVGGLGLSSIGEDWLAGGTTLLVRQRWIMLWGLVGLFSLLTASSIVLACDVLASARETAPLAALFERRRWLFVLCAWRTWFPTTLATSVGAVFYYLLPAGMTRPISNGVMFDPSAFYACACAVGGFISGGLLAWWGSRQIARESRRWAPGR